jgi:ABC-type transport system involved in multi-copper enzyme maturation permease subunit
MVGAVLHQELLLGSRRNRLYVFRWVYAGWLVAVVFYLFAGFAGEELDRYYSPFRGPTGPARNFYDAPPPARASAPAVVGGRFAEAFVVQQLLLLLLATPAFVAGAVTDEKRRGTLPQLLTTGLDTRHILLGKLLGRTAQVLLLAVAGLPPFALLAGFAGVGPLTLLVLAATLAAPLFALASASVLASVWCRQTRDAVLALYVLGTLGGLAVWYFGGPLEVLNPLYVLAPAWGPSAVLDLAEAGRRLAASALGWTALGGACLAVAVWRLRPACRRDLEGGRPAEAAPPTWHSAPLPAVTDEPVRWRERQVEGLAPHPALRRVRTWLGVAAVAAATTGSSLFILAANLPAGVGPADALRAVVSLRPAAVRAVLPDAALGFLVQSLVAMLLASLVVGVRCSGAITGERERQTWEALLLTPLSARELIRGKLWGVMGASLWYLLAYAAPAVVFSAMGGLMALFWTVLWLAVTVLAMYYVGAAGLWCSARARNSWRSLLGTLAAGYLGGIVLYLVSSPAPLIAAAVLSAVLQLFDRTYGTRTSAFLPANLAAFETPFLIMSSVSLALIFWLMSRTFLAHALRWVADRERTRHWHEEPVYRRSRRRAFSSPRPAG